MVKYSVTVSAASAQELADATFKVGEALAELANVSAVVAINIGGSQKSTPDDAPENGAVIGDIDPASIHEFDGKKYRKVERKGAFGELVLITRSENEYVDECTVKSIGHVSEDGGLYVHDRDGDGVLLTDKEDFSYVVLEPISLNEANA